MALGAVPRRSAWLLSMGIAIGASLVLIVNSLLGR